MSIASAPTTRIPPSTLAVRLMLAREWRGYKVGIFDGLKVLT